MVKYKRGSQNPFSEDEIHAIKRLREQRADDTVFKDGRLAAKNWIYNYASFSTLELMYSKSFPDCDEFIRLSCHYKDGCLHPYDHDLLQVEFRRGFIQEVKLTWTDLRDEVMRD